MPPRFLDCDYTTLWHNPARTCLARRDHSFRRIGLRHGHAAYDLPLVSAFAPRVRDTNHLRRSVPILIDPLEGDPVTHHRHVPSHLDRRGFKSDRKSTRLNSSHLGISY